MVRLLPYVRFQKNCVRKKCISVFGTDFSGNEMPLDTILRKLKWKQPNSFDLLNDKMQKEEKYAILIIDAINEGAGMYFWQEKLPILFKQLENGIELKS